MTLGGEFATAINNCGLWFVQPGPGGAASVLQDHLINSPLFFSLAHRLNGIGSTPSSPDCDTWDNWSVSFSYFFWPWLELIDLLGLSTYVGILCHHDCQLTASHSRVHGRTAKFLFLDMENW